MLVNGVTESEIAGAVQLLVMTKSINQTNFSRSDTI